MTSTVAFCFAVGGESSIANICLLWGLALEEEGLAPQAKHNGSSQHNPQVDGNSDPRWESSDPIGKSDPRWKTSGPRIGKREQVSHCLEQVILNWQKLGYMGQILMERCLSMVGLIPW